MTKKINHITAEMQSFYTDLILLTHVKWTLSFDIDYDHVTDLAIGSYMFRFGITVRNSFYYPRRTIMNIKARLQRSKTLRSPKQRPIQEILPIKLDLVLGGFGHPWIVYYTTDTVTSFPSSFLPIWGFPLVNKMKEDRSSEMNDFCI